MLVLGRVQLGFRLAVLIAGLSSTVAMAASFSPDETPPIPKDPRQVESSRPIDSRRSANPHLKSRIAPPYLPSTVKTTLTPVSPRTYPHSSPAQSETQSDATPRIAPPFLPSTVKTTLSPVSPRTYPHSSPAQSETQSDATPRIAPPYLPSTVKATLTPVGPRHTRAAGRIGVTFTSSDDGTSRYTRYNRTQYTERRSVHRSGSRNYYVSRRSCDFDGYRYERNFRFQSWGTLGFWAYYPTRYFPTPYYSYLYNPWAASGYRAPIIHHNTWWGGYQWRTLWWENRVNYGFYWNWYTTYPSFSYLSVDFLFSELMEARYRRLQYANALDQVWSYNAPAAELARLQQEFANYKEEYRLQREQALLDLQKEKPILANEALSRARHRFVVNEALDATSVDEQGNDQGVCALTETDMIERDANHPIVEGQPFAVMRVLASMRGDCSRGQLVLVSIPQLQAMEDYAQGRTEEAATKLQSAPGAQRFQ